MTTFLFAYRAPSEYQPGDPEAVAAWRTFFDGIGRQLVDKGNPVFSRVSVGNGAGDTVLGGYSMVEAADLDEAVALATGCPLVTSGGGVEVGEITRLDPDSLTATVASGARAASAAA